MEARSAREWLVAGVVGRPHGLDGSFHVARPRPQLLTEGARVLCRYDPDTRRIVFDAERSNAGDLGTPPTP